MNETLTPNITYLREVLTPATEIEQILRESIAWEREILQLYGRNIAVPRQVAWYGDPGCNYRYSGKTHQALPWLAPLNALREQVQQHSGYQFNSVLANLYQDGNEYMGWHSDAEPELGDNPVIASLSLGASRRFVLRHKHNHQHKVEYLLEHGSLLIMHAGVQALWQHSLPKMKRCQTPRINLTFRAIVNPAAL